MTTPVTGDPACCSQAGGALRRLATRVRDSAGLATQALSTLEQAWSGGAARAARSARASERALTSAGEVVAEELDRVGAALQGHAAELAEAVQTVRLVEDRARAAGLEVVDARVVPAWGVSGVADAAAAVARDERRASLQAELDTALVLLGRRRARLVAAAERSRGVLAEQAAALRR